MEYIIGDCLEKLDLVKDESIALIYLDPPFDSGRDYTMSHENSMGFSDTWKGGDYKDFIERVIDKCIPKLKKDGSLFFHISAEKMFTPEQILREKFKYIQPIFWKKCRSKNNVKHKLGATIDIIFRCNISKNPKFNLVYQSRDEMYVKNSFNNKDDRGNYSLGHVVTENTKKGTCIRLNSGIECITHHPGGELNKKNSSALGLIIDFTHQRQRIQNYTRRFTFMRLRVNHVQIYGMIFTPSAKVLSYERIPQRSQLNSSNESSQSPQTKGTLYSIPCVARGRLVKRQKI